MIVNYTDKKFYNKWLFKASISLTGARVLAWMTNLHDLRHVVHRQPVDIDGVIGLHNFLNNYQSREWQKRIESHQIDIYTNNENLHNELINTFHDRIIKISIPGDHDYSEKGKFEIIYRNSLPHKKYKFKVYLKPHLITDVEEKKKFISFVDFQEDKIKMSNAVKNWFIENTINWDPRYIYVEDEETLVMLKLKRSDVVGRIYEIVIG